MHHSVSVDNIDSLKAAARCQLYRRRDLLRNTAAGFGHVALIAMLGDVATGSRTLASEPEATQPDSPLAAKAPHLPARAKRIIFLFMKGGPSHVDTFDPKPILDRDHGKPPPFALPRVTFAAQGSLLRSPWRFRQHGQSGLAVSELFPHVAKHVDDLCILRSLHGTNPAHGGALLKLHTGSDQFVRPSMGSWIVYGLGTENQHLPAFLTICPTLAHGGVNNWGAAFLPAHCQGTPIGNASQSSERAQVRHIRNDRIPKVIQRRQIDLIRALNQRQLESVQNSADQHALAGRLQSYELAFQMQATMPEAQNLSDETEITHRLYGLDDPITANFGRQCLMARRFIERGVRFVQVTHSDSEVQWDQHANLYQGHTKNAAEVDKPIAGLLSDLKNRGLLEDTLVLWGGEFGRTPTAEGSNGRDHNPHGFTMWLAGGGVRCGIAYGQTDDYGYYAAVDKMHIHDLHATLLHLLGLDHLRLTFHYAGRDFRLTDVAGKVAHAIIA